MSNVKHKTKVLGYREMIEYIVLNDDISELGDEGENKFPSCLMSACAHLFLKDEEEVTKSLRNKRDQFRKEGIIS